MNTFFKKSKFQARGGGSGSSAAVLENRFILYFLFFAAIVDIVNMITKNEIFYLVLFLLAGMGVASYSKNMVVILLISIVFIHLVKYGAQMYPNSGAATGAGGFPIYEGVENQTPAVISATNAGEKLAQANTDLKDVVSAANSEYLDTQKKIAELKKTLEDTKLQSAKTGT